MRPAKCVLSKKQLASNKVAEKFAAKLSALQDDQRRFEYTNQRVLSHAQIPSYAPKSSRQIAQSEPWNGSENSVEMSRRMLEDKYKPLRLSPSSRLHNARENVLDYTLNEAEGSTVQDRLAKARKKRRGLNHRIEENDAIPDPDVDGEHAPRVSANATHQEMLASMKNPQIDFTEYLLNRIIQKQGGAPPWIMKQKALTDRISTFREQIRRRLQERLVHRVAELADNDLFAAMKLARSGVYNKDEEWESNYRDFHREVIDDINRQIRGYNLQAPLSARRGYLRVDDEIRRCQETVLTGIEEELRKYVGLAQVPKLEKSQLHSYVPPLESPENHYGIKQLVSDLFKRKPTG